MSWKYAMIKVSESPSGDVCWLVEIFKDENGSYSTYIPVRLMSIKEVEAAYLDVKRDGVNYYFWNNGKFRWSKEHNEWMWKPDTSLKERVEKRIETTHKKAKKVLSKISDYIDRV